MSDVKDQIKYQESLITLARGTAMTGRLSTEETAYLMLETAVLGLRGHGADLAKVQHMVAGVYQQVADEEAKEAGKGPTTS